MNQRLFIAMMVPGFVAGLLVVMGVWPNLLLLLLLWLFIVILYPFIVVAQLQHNRLFYTFLTVLICGSLIVWLPVEEYALFYKNNPEKIDWLNYAYRHPRRMILAIGQTIVFFSAVIAAIISDILLGLNKTNTWLP